MITNRSVFAENAVLLLEGVLAISMITPLLYQTWFLVSLMQSNKGYTVLYGTE